jgi:hypothetical protein
MKTKLTLSVDKELVQFARAQVRRDGKSISSTFSDFLLSRKAQTEHQAVPKIRDMVGSLKAYSIDDSKVAIRTHYAQKYSN